MRWMMLLAAGSTLALGGCGKSTEEKATQNAAVAKFVPPTTMARADFGGSIERRFHRLDVNGDDRLSATELPGKNGERLLKRYDKDGNGAIDSSEWGTMMLERFDRLDANHDGSVTTDERMAARAARQGRLGDNAADANDAMK